MTNSYGGTRTGKPAKPTALKVLHGDFKTHPERRNKNEPTVRGEVRIPPHLTPQAREMWDELAPMLIRAGILTPPDGPLFAEFCEATVVVRITRLEVMRVATGQIVIAPGAASPMTAYVRAINVLTNLGGRFGLTPADRTRLVVMESGHGPTDDLISNG